MGAKLPGLAGQSRPDEEFYLSVGPLAAILIGMALVPLRGFTIASNFTFAFVVLTIVVAELGGGRAAFVTALASTLSLDFFLTEPYLKLTIASKHDVIAFCGLAVCGAVSAALASHRGRRQQAFKVALAQLDLLHAGVREMDEAGSGHLGLQHLVDTLRSVALLSAVAVRDESGSVMASSGELVAAPPRELLATRDLLVLQPAPQRIPPEGNRIPLKLGTRAVGSLDLWGDGTPLRADVRRLLSDLAALLGARLGREAAVLRP
jgi:K+-sensing histidine kinase KdpD